MTPYATFTYFGVLLYWALPTLAAGLAGLFAVLSGRISRALIVIASATMLLVHSSGLVQLWPGTAVYELGIVAAFAAVQWLVAAAFLRIRSRSKQRGAFYAALALGIAPLAAAKLWPFLVPGSAFGFVGISYVTFRGLDVVIGIQDRLITALAPLQYLAYLFFFPTVSSGPIDRYRRFGEDWKRQRSRREFAADLDAAIHRIFTGFLYKFVLAALITRYWLAPLESDHGPLSTLGYMYAYSLYLFFDFAGYSAFAIGVSYLFGIHTPENFARPFLASNIREFWNRWHISLSAWFRDHVYMRFVLAATRGRWFTDRYTASYLGLFLSMGLMGAWHGLQPYYLLYGLYHGALLAGQEWFGRWNRERQLWGDGPLWRVASVVLTFHAVCFGFLLFSGRLGPTWPGSGS